MYTERSMLPPPRAAIFGASAPTRKYGARTVAANSRSKVASMGLQVDRLWPGGKSLAAVARIGVN
jgi:hypothetical protein